MKRNNKKIKELKLKWKELYFSLKNTTICKMLNKKEIDSDRNRKSSALFYQENN